MIDPTPLTAEDALELALPQASATAWAVAGYPEPGPDPTYWERFAHGVRGVLNANGWDVVPLDAERTRGLDVDVRVRLAKALHAEFWTDSLPHDEGEVCCLPSADRVLAALAPIPEDDR